MTHAITLLLAILSGLFLTLMDQIDEHDLITGKFKTPLAYLFGILCAASFIISIHMHGILVIFISSMLIEWIFKDKIDYPSHVFFLSLVVFYIGINRDLFFKNIYSILAMLILTYLMALARKYTDRKIHSAHLKWYYRKLIPNIGASIVVGSYFMFIYTVLFAISCYFTKTVATNLSKKQTT